MIRAAIDLRPLGRQATGIGTYLTALLQGCSRRPSEVSVTGLSFSLRRPLPPPAWWPESWPWRVGRLPWSVQRSWWPRVPWPAASCWAGPVDLLHATSPFIPPPGRLPLVVTVHDVGFLRLPEARPRELTGAVERAFLAALRRANAIVAVSAFTAREAADAAGIDAARIRVVHSALPPDAAAVSPHDAGEPYLLALGTAEPRKNLAVLIEAWAILGKGGKPPLLIVCGPCDTPEGERLRAAAAGLGIGERIRFIGFAPQAQVRSLLAGASGLLFPSRYEGFGYPLLEAFREGCPVAAADCTSLPEVGGDAVRLLSPDDPAAWAETAAAFAADETLRRRLAAAGRERLAAFTLDAMVAGHLAAYREAV